MSETQLFTDKTTFVLAAAGSELTTFLARINLSIDRTDEDSLYVSVLTDEEAEKLIDAEQSNSRTVVELEVYGLAKSPHQFKLALAEKYFRTFRITKKLMGEMTFSALWGATRPESAEA